MCSIRGNKRASNECKKNDGMSKRYNMEEQKYKDKTKDRIYKSTMILNV